MKFFALLLICGCISCSDNGIRPIDFFYEEPRFAPLPTNVISAVGSFCKEKTPLNIKDAVQFPLCRYVSDSTLCYSIIMNVEVSKENFEDVMFEHGRYFSYYVCAQFQYPKDIADVKRLVSFHYRYFVRTVFTQFGGLEAAGCRSVRYNVRYYTMAYPRGYVDTFFTFDP